VAFEQAGINEQRRAKAINNGIFPVTFLGSDAKKSVKLFFFPPDFPHIVEASGQLNQLQAA
jgi:hypothetical protein